MIRHRAVAGFTLLELVVVATVFLIVLGALVATLRAADETARSNMARTDAVEQSKNAIQKVAQEIEESGLATVACSTGYRSTSGNSAYSNTKSLQNDSGKQCNSATCAWSYNSTTGAYQYPETHLVDSRYNVLLPSPTTTVNRYGRVWPESFTSCPLDGSPLLSGSYQGSLRFFSPRDKNGDFITDEYSAAEATNQLTKKQDWQAIVFYVPFYNSDRQTTELRRYVFYKSDLFASSPEHTWYWGGQSNWTAWSANMVRDATGALQSNLPTLIDLLDFGKDGTTDLVPDGSVPRRPEDSDAQYEDYKVTSSLSGSQVEGTLTWWKYIYDSASSEYRDFWFTINLRTGQITCWIYFARNSWNDTWYRSVAINRTPQTIVSGLRAVDFSTNLSNPYDATSNPGGVQSADVVRISFLLDRDVIRKGAREIKESVLTQQVSPRNF